MTAGAGSRLAAWVWDGTTWPARAVRGSLGPASHVYGAVMRLRNRAYDRGWAHVEPVGARVLSVGNLVVGGTGKSPTALWLADALRLRGHRVAIVARGYGKTRPGVVVVGTQGVPLVSAAEGGDEAVMLAGRFAGPVITAERRVAAARVASDEFGCDVIVLDDGFQHRALSRQADLVLLQGDPTLARLLPAGPLRESAAALRRATAVLLLGAGELPALPALPAGPPMFRGRTIPDGLVDAGGAQKSLRALAGLEVVVVAGVAHPERLVGMLRHLGARVGTSMLFPDHHVYRARDIARICDSTGTIVTTEKDLVKLAGRLPARPVWALRIRVEIEREAALLAALGESAPVDFTGD